jgi:hypothetical protein
MRLRDTRTRNVLGIITLKGSSIGPALGVLTMVTNSSSLRGYLPKAEPCVYCSTRGQ